MARTTTDVSKIPFLPASVAAFLRRRMVELGGAALFIFGLASLLAFFSFSSTDPSLNKAVDGTVSNLMGIWGAIGADIGLQSMGIAASLPGIAMLVWGWRVVTKRPIPRAWLKITVMPFALLFIAMGAAGFAPPVDWSLRAGMGGYLGQLVLGQTAGLIGETGLRLPIVLIGMPFLLIGLMLGLYTLGFSPAEWRAFGRTMWRGTRVGGLFLGARATAGWQMGRNFGANGIRNWGRTKTRTEPRMGLRSNRAPNAIDIDETDVTLSPDEDIGPSSLLETPKPEAPTEPLVTPRSTPARQGRRADEGRQTMLDLVRDGNYELPPLDLLAEPPVQVVEPEHAKESLEANARLLMGVLEDFGVKGQILKVRPGPVVTLYELEPAAGIKSSRVIGLADDIARSMSAVSVRIAVVPGQNVIGIELPNARREMVSLRELLSSEAYERTASKLTLVLGKDIGGAPVMADLARMPHLLIAGTTGSGKSVAINTMILSLLYRLTPDECRFIMIDPKMLELSVYDDIPHLLAPVVTEPGKAVVALKWTVKEMENRYRSMSELGVRNVANYNQRVAEASNKGQTLTRSIQTGFDPETGKPVIEEHALDLKPMPLIVVVVDEMADLMMVAGKEIEGTIQRLSQMARAAGIHLIMATQRPSVDVITGTIKANFPTRVSFQVTSKVDSRTILSEGGAEQLLGQGDMLYMAGGGRITRVHGPFVSDQEVEKIVAALKSQGEPEYIDAVTIDESADISAGAGGNGNNDALYDQAGSLVLRERRASTSFIQRHLQIGYNRAARIMDQMEADGVVSSANHAGKREVLPGGTL